MNKKIIYAKVDNIRGQKNNQVMCHGKYVVTKTCTWGINPHLNQFKKGSRVRITIETVPKEEYTKKCYEGKGEFVGFCGKNIIEDVVHRRMDHCKVYKSKT